MSKYEMKTKKGKQKRNSPSSRAVMLCWICFPWCRAQKKKTLTVAESMAQLIRCARPWPLDRHHDQMHPPLPTPLDDARCTYTHLLSSIIFIHTYDTDIPVAASYTGNSWRWLLFLTKYHWCAIKWAIALDVCTYRCRLQWKLFFALIFYCEFVINTNISHSKFVMVLFLTFHRETQKKEC